MDSWKDLVARYPSAEAAVGSYLTGIRDRAALPVSLVATAAEFLAAVRAVNNPQSVVVGFDADMEVGQAPSVKFDGSALDQAFGGDGAVAVVLIDMSGGNTKLVVLARPAE